MTFHFDCIIATVKTEVHFFLQSSPKPDHNAQYTDTVLEIGGKLIHSPRNSVALMKEKDDSNYGNQTENI